VSSLNCIRTFFFLLVLPHPDLILLYISEWFTVICFGNLQAVSMTLPKICSCGVEMNCLFMIGACSPWFDFVIYIGMIHRHLFWKPTGRKYDTSKDLQLWCRDELPVYDWCLLTLIWFCLISLNHSPYCCWKRIARKYDTVNDLQLRCHFLIVSEPFVYVWCLLTLIWFCYISWNDSPSLLLETYRP